MMNRDKLYIVSGTVVFIITFILLLFVTELSIIRITGIALLVSLASDVVIIFDNDRRNTAPDAKFHHRNELVGEIAQVLEEFRIESGSYTGKINIRGETWDARSSTRELKPGDRVRIIDRTGMTFTVERYGS